MPVCVVADDRHRKAAWPDWVTSTHSKDNDTRHVDLTAYPSCLDSAELAAGFGRSIDWVDHLLRPRCATATTSIP